MMAMAMCVHISVLGLCTFTTDAAGELDILGHDGDTLGVDSAQVGILKETDQIGFGGFLEGEDSSTLETKIVLEVLGNLTDQSLERELADKKVSRLLILADLTECNSTRSVTMRFVDTTSGRGRFTCGLGGKLLSWGLSTS